MRLSISHLTILILVTAFFSSPDACRADNSITIETPATGTVIANGGTIKPHGTSTYYELYVTIRIVNTRYENGQQQTATFEKTVLSGEFGVWDYPEDVTLHGSGYWSVTAFPQHDPSVVDINYGGVSAP